MQEIVRQLTKVLPVTEVHLLGSFTTKKRRPADVDLIVLLKTKSRTEWSVDLVLAPDNPSGEAVLQDARKWMKQKYGAKNSMVLRLA